MKCIVCVAATKAGLSCHLYLSLFSEVAGLGGELTGVAGAWAKCRRCQFRCGCGYVILHTHIHTRAS